ncbi:MAG TPA: SGNH/GDSL hydrolase family protein, partial [Candidatus Eisenbacteria bacterium]|nr:SGNH/GDSL hydrolase family protein [Candidatus Eisenbacteria bacterium]
MPQSRLKNFLKKLALLLTSLAVFTALIEGVLRVQGYGNVELYEPDPQLYWRLRPNQDCYTKIDHRPVHINSWGTRGPEFLPAKPPNTLRIVSLGDSRTFGWGLSEAETYSGRLEKLLRERLEQNVEVINAGVNAWSYPQMLVFFRERALAWQPDIVLLAGANLWTQFSERNDPVFVRKFMTRVRLKNVLRRSALYHFIVEVQLKEFYVRHRTRFIPIDPKQDALFKEQQQKDPDAFFKRAMEDLCQLALSKNVRPVMVFLPVLNDLETGSGSNVLKAQKEISRTLS